MSRMNLHILEFFHVSPPAASPRKVHRCAAPIHAGQDRVPQFTRQDRHAVHARRIGLQYTPRTPRGSIRECLQWDLDRWLNGLVRRFGHDKRQISEHPTVDAGSRIRNLRLKNDQMAGKIMLENYHFRKGGLDDVEWDARALDGLEECKGSPKCSDRN